MRSVVLAVFLAASACTGTPDLKVGECFILDYGFAHEAWEGPETIYRVEEVGIERYRTSFYQPERKRWLCVARQDACITGVWKFDNDDAKRVECPE